mgnify:CR=1 FL=1
MKAEKINNPADRLHVLVSPLDWGLGHATRCIPVIFKLLQLGCNVSIAAEGAGKILLEKEFPSLNFIELRGYRMQYSRNKFWMPVKLLIQLPKLVYRIYAENRWLKNKAEEYKFDLIISDNRLGLSHKKITCVYITHQLKIKTGNRFTENLAQKIHYHFINKYKTCWVPDADGEINLAGELSHPVGLPATPVKYIGPLSRFNKTGAEIKYDLCIILSGPEPQRSVFEKIMLKNLENYSGKAFLLRGLPGEPDIRKDLSNTLETQNHLPAAELNLIIQQSRMVICRSGYTTVMDLVKLQKKAILVPTPGQTEQEYLAEYLHKGWLFFSTTQQGFVLQNVLTKAANFNFTTENFTQNNYEKIIEDCINSISPTNSADI